MLVRTEAIPATSPAPTKAGIIGTKILEISFSRDFNGDDFCLAFWAAFISAVFSDNASLPDFCGGISCPKSTPAFATIALATLLTFPGPIMTCSCSSLTTPITPGISFNPC